RYGALAAQTGLGVPLDLINVIKSTLILFIAVKFFGNNMPAISDFFRGKWKEKGKESLT
ncbi:MAG: hypothetical protein GX592_06565, partial [Clostridiales bacterium]|nr:hypothetical protein [Clostridiales bacterium]